LQCRTAHAAQSSLLVSAKTGGGSLRNDFGFSVTTSGRQSQFQGTIGDGRNGSLQLISNAGDIALDRQ
jgi:hypothetical protein